MTPKKGTILIAKDPCEMKNGNALIIGKEYQIHYISTNGHYFYIKSELYKDHAFGAYVSDWAYWGNFFTIKTEQ